MLTSVSSQDLNSKVVGINSELLGKIADLRSEMIKRVADLHNTINEQIIRKASNEEVRSMLEEKADLN